jgi:diaminopimelate decarboxylase
MSVHPVGSERSRFWRRLVKEALRSVATPFYLFSVEPIKEALAELALLQACVPVPLRPWLSCKTQPVRPLLRWWQTQGGGIEVVSEFELKAALALGFPPDRVLVNGPAKHSWLIRHPLAGLRVNFDSAAEIRQLLPMARKFNWSLGIRCQTQQEHDPANPRFPTQFGMSHQEAVLVLKQLQRSGGRLETIHFHLRTNVERAVSYDRALGEIAAICRVAGFSPAYVDCGGGYPAPGVLSPKGLPYDHQFDTAALGEIYTRALKHFPDLREIWIENGRFLTARSGVLAVRILESKNRPPLRFLICDGGRTLNALVSAWESHDLFSIPERRGGTRLTAVCGPTCMAFDQLTRRALAARLRVGDCLVWLDAGAYHIPWETRFSHGHCSVLWHEDSRLTEVRRHETFETWWQQWETRE